MIVAISVAVAAVALVLYPKFGAPMVPGAGSDRDDAINVALQRLFAGNYPYSGRTYLGNPLTPLPGSLLLALPSYLVTRTSGYASVYLVPLALLLTRRVSARAAFGLGLGLVGSLAFWHEVATGGDLAVTSLVQAAVAIAVVAYTSRGTIRKPAIDLLAFGVLAVVCTTRATSMLVLLGALVLAAPYATWGRTLIRTLASAAVVICLVVPFWAFSPTNFGPARTSRFLVGLGYGSLTILFTAALVAWWVWAARRRRPDTTTSFASGISVWSVATAIIYTIATRQVDNIAYASFSFAAGIPPTNVDTEKSTKQSAPAPQ